MATLTAANTNGWSLDVYGIGGTNSNNAYIFPQILILMPPLRNQYVYIHGAGIYWTSAVTDRCLSLDSMVEAAVIVEGSRVSVTG